MTTLSLLTHTHDYMSIAHTHMTTRTLLSHTHIHTQEPSLRDTNMSPALVTHAWCPAFVTHAWSPALLTLLEVDPAVSKRGLAVDPGHHAPRR